MDKLKLRSFNGRYLVGCFDLSEETKKGRNESLANHITNNGTSEEGYNKGNRQYAEYRKEKTNDEFLAELDVNHIARFCGDKKVCICGTNIVIATYYKVLPKNIYSEINISETYYKNQKSKLLDKFNLPSPEEILLLIFKNHKQNFFPVEEFCKMKK